MVIYSGFPLFAITQRLLQQQPKPPKPLSGVSFSKSDAPPGAALAGRMGWRTEDGGSTGQLSMGWGQGLQDPEIKLGPNSSRGAPPENSRGGAPSLLLGRFLPAPSSALLLQGASTWPGAPQLHISSCHSPLPLPLAVSRHCAGSHRPLNQMNK